MPTSDWSITTLSVISSSSDAGSRPVAARIAATLSTRSAWANWRADRLTDMTSGAPPGPAARQARACRQAVSRTQRPIGTISPVSSASGMNASGGTSPRVGCCQRTSASNPTIGVGREVDERLVVEPQLVALERPPQVVLEVDPLERLARIIDGSNRAWRPAGSDFARTIAISASRRSSPGVVRPGRPMAMPIDALMNHSRPSSGNGARSSASSRSAMRRASSTSSTGSRMIPNSSPPNRATVSPGRRQRRPAAGRRPSAAGRRRRGRGSR